MSTTTEHAIQNLAGALPLVSVIIPTYRRPDVIASAVRSVFAQSYANLEVLVVSDGPDAETRAVVATLADHDSRLRWIELPVNVGPAQARNAGVHAARGEWIAFLDDDDEWLPAKLQQQMALAAANGNDPCTIISCRSFYRHSGRDDASPAKPIAPGEDIADYVLVRPGLLRRPGIVSLQSLVVHRSILTQVPFTTWRDHEDWSWLLEAWHRAGARVRFVWLPLLVYNIDVHSISRSRRMNWQESLEWVEAHRHWISDQAYCSFLTTKVALKAKRAGDYKALASIGRRVLRTHPSLLDLCFLAGMFLLPGALLNEAWKRSLRPPNAADQPAAAVPVYDKVLP